MAVPRSSGGISADDVWGCELPARWFDVAMKLFLPKSKIQKILLACSDLISKPRSAVRQEVHVTGLLASAFPAINCLRLNYRSIELCKFQALSTNQDFDHLKALRPQAVSALNWITENLTKFNGSYFLIKTDRHYY